MMQSQQLQKSTPNHRLIRARKRRGWSQEKLAEQIGAASAKNIGRWERGKVVPSLYFQERLCDLFGMSAEELGFLKEESPHRQPSPLSSQEQKARTNGDEPSSQEAIAIHETLQQKAIKKKPLLVNIPFQRNPFFLGRNDLLEQVHTWFLTDPSARSLPLAITGLGGIGKTQLALEYLFRYMDEYETILWVSADSDEILAQQCAEIINALQRTQDFMPQQNSTIEAFKQWLSHQNQWLLVIDNVEEIMVLNQLLPVSRNGHVLLTTRTPVTGELAHQIELGKLDQETGALLLLQRAKKIAKGDPLDCVTFQDQEQAKTIAWEMDGLPLAIVQAGAYIEETACSVSQYLDLYRANHAKLLNRRGAPHSGYPQSVATTWAISFEKIQQRNLAAIELLRFLAFLPPDAVPESLIQQGAPLLPPHLRSVAGDPFELDEAIGALRLFSLVQRNAEQETLSVHRLVQTVVRDQLGPEGQRKWAEHTVKAVNEAFSSGVYLLQAQGCATLIEQWDLVSEEAISLLYQAGYEAQQRMLYQIARPLLLQALSLAERVFGPESLAAMSCLMSLSSIYLEQGQIGQVEQWKQRVLQIGSKELESLNDSILTDYLFDLAHHYNNQGYFKEAEACYQQIRVMNEEAVEHDPKFFLTMLCRFAINARYQQKWEEAATLCEQAYAFSQDTFGPESSETMVCAQELAEVYLLQGKHAQAEILLEQLCQSSAGEDTWTIECLGSLADAYSFQEKYAQAEPIYQRAIALLEQRKFPDLGQMLKLLLGYSSLLWKSGRLEEAHPMMKRAEMIYNALTKSTPVDPFWAD